MTNSLNQQPQESSTDLTRIPIGCIARDHELEETMKGTIGGCLDNIRMLWRYGFTSPMDAQKLCVLFLSTHAHTHRTQTSSHIYRGSRKSKETALCIFESPPPPNETSNTSSQPVHHHPSSPNSPARIDILYANSTQPSSPRNNTPLSSSNESPRERQFKR